VLAFVTQFIPMEVIDFPKHGSIIYHPSILPRHRGASAINWTLMCGDEVGGFTIFWADDGLDTGPILLTRETKIEPDDTVNSLYKRFLFPEGIKAMGEAVQLIQEGKAPRIKQPEEGATYDKIWKSKDLAKVNWHQPAKVLHNFIRGNDKVPGAWTTINGQVVSLFNSTYIEEHTDGGQPITVEDSPFPDGNYVTDKGIVLTGSDGKKLLVRLVQVGKKTISASEFLKAGDEGEDLQLNENEQAIVAKLKGMWQGILSTDNVQDDTDFFESGAGSMDVTRLIDGVTKICNGISVDAEQVYMNTSFKNFVRLVITRLRGGDTKSELKFKSVMLHGNGVDVCVPIQMLINGQFVDAKSGKTDATVNPTTEEPLCQIPEADKDDVNLAVQAAKDAFETGLWRKMNARDRGRVMYKLADLMEEHKEELAIIESLDSGAVYTLALKTHVGMSIDTFRYFAGWCDKIQGKTIPINNARPNFNLCYTKKEPIGVCGIVIPWNYPLMMLAWKMAACLAAGNTVVLKPAKVTPLTALKFAELTIRAGFPPGVINILTGSGARIGQAIADHPDVRKLGFTGSTQIGKTIMESAAKSNLKKVSLELGGKSPLIIFEDCDMDKAVRFALSACFFNKGENCIAAGRLFVQDSIHDEFLKRVVVETKKMKIGDPLDMTTDHGPQNHLAHLEKLLEYVETGKKEGATLVYGGKRLDRKGYFLEPTIFTNVKDDTFMAKEESFGPIMIISTFDGDVDTVIKRANATEYGLSSGVMTRDINKALRVSDGLEAGTCYINTYNKTDVASPFGGFKQSGFGKDLGEEALNEYLKTKAVTVEYS